MSPNNVARLGSCAGPGGVVGLMSIVCFVGALVFLIVLAIIIYVVVSQSNIAAATSPATATTAANQSPNVGLLPLRLLPTD